MYQKNIPPPNILIISDEVYEHITFDGMPHFSISSSTELKKRSFVISSFGKTFHTTGWKVGYCCAPEDLTNEFRKIHQFIVFAVNTPVQHAYSTFLLNENNYFSSSNRTIFALLIWHRIVLELSYFFGVRLFVSIAHYRRFCAGF